MIPAPVNPRRAPVLALLLAAAAPAQILPSPGDWIIGDSSSESGGIFSVSPANGAVLTLAVARPTGFFNWVAMGANNADLAAVRALPGRFAFVPPAGGIAWGVSLAGVANGFDLDQDGSWLTVTSAADAVWRVSADGTTATFLLAAPPGLDGVCVDQDTGDAILAIFAPWPNGALLRLSRATGALTTIASGLGRVSAVDHCAQDGTFYLSRHDSGEVLNVSPGGSVTTVHVGWPAGVRSASCLKVVDETGELLVGGLVSSLPGRVALLSRTGLVLAFQDLPLYLHPTGVELYGSRKVSGLGTFAAGRPYTVSFSFPRSAGRPYVAALSTGLRPGLALPDGRTINLAPDALLARSLGGLPGITTGFAGILDAGGRAAGTITPPAGFPAGVRLFVSAVALNPAFPGGLDTANTLGATTR
jgi:hypothetical protein